MIKVNGVLLSNFIWQDELVFHGIVQQQERALNGALSIEKSNVETGRPITLYSSIEDYELYESLQLESKNGLDSFPLDIHGEVFTVAWDYQSVPIEGTPLKAYSDSKPEHVRGITLKFITV